MVKAAAAVESASENRATETLLLKTSPNEKGKKGSSKEDVQENIETPQLVPSTEKGEEAPYSKQRKKNKNRSPKVKDAGQKKLLPPENRDADVATTTNLVADKTNLEQSAKKLTNGQSASGTARQECLEHDQSIVALASMVRHIEVQLKQQQQQSVGRSLIALEDIIRQAETLDLELRDLETEVNRASVTAEQMLKHQQDDVPPQLLLALEKDKESLARGYEAARALSAGILQSLKDHKESRKAAITAEKMRLEEQVEDLLAWLVETEAHMSGGMLGMDNTDQADTEVHCDQQLSLCKDLQSALTARSNEVNSVAFNIQMFISEQAQDLAPQQSRQLLRQLQQLQRTFHRALCSMISRTNVRA
ncbi:unnamed protein product [Tetraodon nigroviridis]|uniref:Chromosome undetermined SCAF14949, whole genome shotgun sequence n=1 Tax=Tetraodon nigroviridis TaxID=99883 RepID=Q4RZ86_TETNG|nr:unnamed protein product [Tetraodon nigroviridis]